VEERVEFLDRERQVLVLIVRRLPRDAHLCLAGVVFRVVSLGVCKFRIWVLCFGVQG